MAMTISGDGSITGLVAGGLPDASVTQADLASPVYAKGTPAFSAYQSSAQTISSATFTKIQFQTEEFDTNSNFDTSTYRFTPTVAGYYQVSARAAMSASNVSNLIEIWKNGASYKRGVSVLGAAGDGTQINCLVYLNGSTDYIEAYYYLSTGQALVNSSTQTYFQASLVRGA